jgi:hypothetical protein
LAKITTTAPIAVAVMEEKTTETNKEKRQLFTTLATFSFPFQMSLYPNGTLV